MAMNATKAIQTKSFGASALKNPPDIFFNWGRINNKTPKLPKLIVGLGNPGYEGTRHNLGSDWVIRLAQKCNQKFNKENDILCNVCTLKNPSKTMLITPLNFMNLSGFSVQRCMEKYSLKQNEIGVVHDDLQLEVGKYQVKQRGSLRGHHGLLNISRILGNESIKRISLGIGRPKSHKDIVEYVLDRIPLEEEREMENEFFSVLMEELIRVLYRPIDNEKDKGIIVGEIGRNERFDE